MSEAHYPRANVQLPKPIGSERIRFYFHRGGFDDEASHENPLKWELFALGECAPRGAWYRLAMALEELVPETPREMALLIMRAQLAEPSFDDPNDELSLMDVALWCEQLGILVMDFCAGRRPVIVNEFEVEWRGELSDLFDAEDLRDEPWGHRIVGRAHPPESRGTAWGLERTEAPK